MARDRHISAGMDAIIIGGGLNGPLLALALSQVGLTCTMVDAMPEPDLADAPFDGRAYALSLASSRMLKALGVWDDLAHAEPIMGIRASDGRPGEGASPLHLSFDAADTGEGPMGYMVEDRHLRHVLHARCGADPAIERLFGTKVVGQSTRVRAEVLLDDGGRLNASLIVACDGRGSETAIRAGLNRIGRDYGQTALVCAVAHDLPHDGIAHQFFMPAGPLAILPLSKLRSSLVWTEDAGNAARIDALDPEAYVEELKPRFGSFLGGIALVGKRGTFPLSLNLATELVAPRLALVGDAGHGIHPIAGQGLNLGFKDIAALTEVLAHARRRGEDIGQIDVLRRYQQWRRFDSTLMAMFTDGVNRLFSNDDPLLRGMRDLGMGIVTALPGLRRGFVRQAAGLSGDLPRLLQGKPV